jgi:2,4-dienoyl-CoA reductase-like NADH-dependent reductase (Old Yellow Enzyme family)
MSRLFEPVQIGSVEMPNRFMRSATTSYWSDDRGVVRPAIVELYRNLAAGGIGLIVKGHLYVADAGKAHAGMAGISCAYHAPGLRRLTRAVHQHGGTIVAQLNHAGIHSRVDRAGPSAYVSEEWTARPLTAGEIALIVDAFGDAAERAVAVGFDGVQIHGAHGYLVSQFLSRRVNHRDDAWGGSLERRMRFLLAVYDAVRRRVGDQVPVLLKLNCDDFSPDGFTVEDSVAVAAAICRRGLDALEISGGGVGRREELRGRARVDDPAVAEASFAGYARRVRDAVTPTPVALVHGIRSRRCMDALLDRGVADLVAMSRPFIREPDLVHRLRAGQPAATCTTCSRCSARDVFGKTMLRCHLE